MEYKIFLSHTWEKDEENRDTHKRVLEVKKELEKLGIKTWLDEDNIVHDIDGSMSMGINDCTAIIIFITKKYSNKVNHAANDPSCIDNCYKECIYAYNSKKPCIPVVFEKCMKSTKNWEPGLIKFYFGNRLYINGTGNDYNNIANEIVKLIKRTSERSLQLKVEVESPIAKSYQMQFNQSLPKLQPKSPKSPLQIIKEFCTSPIDLLKKNKVLPYPTRQAPVLKKVESRESQTESPIQKSPKQNYNKKRKLFIFNLFFNFKLL